MHGDGAEGQNRWSLFEFIPITRFATRCPDELSAISICSWQLSGRRVFGLGIDWRSGRGGFRELRLERPHRIWIEKMDRVLDHDALTAQWH